MMTFNRKAFVDIDNTLWDFYKPFYGLLRNINSEFPAPENWTVFDIWEGYCTERQFLDAVDTIHRRQDSPEYQPYPEAKGFLAGLKQHGYHITIASQRSPEFHTQTARWLNQHGLVHDDIHLSFHKTDIITKETTVVVDDAPQVLEKAVQQGALATGLLFPWNRAYQNNGFSLLSNLDQILDRILKYGA